jgi:hypothetical protein
MKKNKLTSEETKPVVDINGNRETRPALVRLAPTVPSPKAPLARASATCSP